MRPRTLVVGRAGLALACGLGLLARDAAAQYGGGGGGFGAPGGGGMQQPPPMGQEPKEEGPAEEAPEEEGRPADLEPLAGYAEQNKRKMQIFELNGYLRLRADYMHDFFLGQGYTTLNWIAANGAPMNGLPPFPVPLECPAPNANGLQLGTANAPPSNCGHKNIGGANLRLRLEPTLNVTDQVRVHAQIDILDNTILGNTPDSLAGIQGYNRPPATMATTTTVAPNALPGVAPAPYLYTTQDAPEIGQNGFVSSIRAKRAWGEIDTEFGSLRFGRMPWNWGRGIYYNSGSCSDCDVGTSVDRVMALTQLYGHQIAVAWDLGPQGYTTQQLSLGAIDPNGYQYDLSQNDDVLQLMGAITKIDSAIQLRERIDRGDVVLNYGLQIVYRTQGNTVNPPTTAPNTMNNMYGTQPIAPSQLPVAVETNALMFTPDVWFKMYYRSFTLEFEGIGNLGKVDHPGPLAVDNQEMTIREFGWVLASELRLYRDSFILGLETGGATGDQAEDASQYLNYRWHFVQQPAGDHSLNNFLFSPDYHVDEIFFRHIVGTVTNAIYVKPAAAYWFDLGQTRAVGLNGSVLYSMAQVPVSTPGNALSYGLEMDIGASYRNTAEGVYGGATWGVFWPFAALNRPVDLWGATNASDASAAQILRIFMGIKF
jgi:uncharacterized protein (TIGR04551 family)